MILLDYHCPACDHRFEALVSRPAPTELACDCGGIGLRVISAPALRMPRASVERGSSAEPPPNAIDTRPLAEGMTRSEWRKRRRQEGAKRRYGQLRQEGVI